MFKKGLRKAKLFDLVLNVLPYEMSDLVDSHMKYGKFRDEFAKRLPKTDTYFDQIKLDRSNRHMKSRAAAKKSNVLIIAIDSVSANHFKRIFPRTHDFLAHNLSDSIVFEHFSSVGANTYPNILAMLTGIIEEDVDDTIKSEIDWYRKWDSTYHDHLPFIWNEFEKLGYVTHYQEDDPSIAIFNYFKNGFR